MTPDVQACGDAYHIDLADVGPCDLAAGHTGPHEFHEPSGSTVSWDQIAWMSLADASEQFGIPRSTLRWHARQGALAYCARKAGKSYEVPRDAVVSLAKLMQARADALHQMRGNR